MKTSRERTVIADEIVRRVDTVAIMTCEEVRDVHARAQASEFDTIFDAEAAPKAMESHGLSTHQIGTTLE